MSDGKGSPVAGLPVAIKVEPRVADGGPAANPFLVHFPTGFVPGEGIKWKVTTLLRHLNMREEFQKAMCSSW